MTDEHYTGEHVFSEFRLPEHSDWQCFMFGNRPGGLGVVYRPRKGGEPHAFARFMMRICFDCVWVKDASPHANVPTTARESELRGDHLKDGVADPAAESEE